MGLHPDGRSEGRCSFGGGCAAGVAVSWQQFLLHVFPENIASAIAENQILQVVVFAILFGLALGRLSRDEARAAAAAGRIADGNDVRVHEYRDAAARRLGVGAALAYTVANSGVGVMFNLGKLLLTLYVALISFGLLAMLPVMLLARIPVLGVFARGGGAGDDCICHQHQRSRRCRGRWRRWRPSACRARLSRS